jgi:hypothetical protein
MSRVVVLVVSAGSLRTLLRDLLQPQTAPRIGPAPTIESDESIVTRFVNEHCADAPGQKVRAEEVYQRFIAQVGKWNRNRFHRALRFPRKRGHANKLYLLDLTWR